MNQSTVASNPRQPLQPVSKVTKAKLNAFNFRPPVQEPEADAPIKRTLVDENDVPIKRNAVSSLPSDGKSSKEAALPTSLPDSTKAVSTPVSRLAWQDLIGDSDSKSEDEDTSPQDKIGWDTKQQPKYGISPMPRQRGVKRARSSSPVSSPAARSKAITPAVNVKKLSAALKSPRADPAIELWDRFSLGGSAAATPLGAANPALANILVSSSPQHTRSVGSGEGGLRRAISCGTNWPKRRRVERVEAMPSSEGTTAEESPSVNTKSSMVNALLKSVTGEINRCKAAQTHQDVLRSPSPKKRRHNLAGHLSGSPKLRSYPKSMPQPSGAVRADEKIGPSNNSSDYEDDDFDDDTLMSLDVDASITHTQQHISQVQAPETAASEGGNVNTSPQEVNLLEDEFGDLDDDVFAAAGDLLSQMDSASNNKHPTTTTHSSNTANPGVNRQILNDPTDDMYEDDFGDFDFEAAEIAATQSVKQSSGSASLVRKSRLLWSFVNMLRCLGVVPEAQGKGNPTLSRNSGFAKPVYKR